MKFLPSIRPFLRMAVALEDIAAALSYFAVADASKNNRMYIPRSARRFQKDESELLHTDEVKSMKRREERYQEFLQNGIKEDEDE